MVLVHATLCWLIGSALTYYLLREVKPIVVGSGFVFNDTLKFHCLSFVVWNLLLWDGDQTINVPHFILFGSFTQRPFSISSFWNIYTLMEIFGCQLVYVTGLFALEYIHWIVIQQKMCDFQSELKLKQVCRAQHIPLPEGPGQVKLPLRQVHFDIDFLSLESDHFYIIEPCHTVWFPCSHYILMRV